jgi:uncharacterized protein
MSDLDVQEEDAAIRIRVRLKPRAAKNRILGIKNGNLEVSVTAPPIEGAANDELVRTLASALGLPRSAVSLVSGRTSRNKVVRLAGMSQVELEARLRR